MKEIKETEHHKQRELSEKEKKEIEEILDYDWLNNEEEEYG